MTARVYFWNMEICGSLVPPTFSEVPMSDPNNSTDKASRQLMPWSPAARLSMLQMRWARELRIRDSIAHGASVGVIAADEGLAEAEARTLVGELLAQSAAEPGASLMALPI
jgi:hypothetical protein